MAFINKQKFSIEELFEKTVKSPHIFLHEPEFYSRSLLKRHLLTHGLMVSEAEKMEDLVLMLKFTRPDLVIVSPHSENSLEVFFDYLQAIRNQYGDLQIITIGFGLSPETVARLINLGVLSHLERAYSRPADVGHLVKMLLKLN